MYGIEIWVIFQERHGQRYYYKGTERRGRRVWTPNRDKAFTFSDKSEALDFWSNELQSIGGVAGRYI